LPLGVLRAGDVRFEPALQSKATLISKMGWGEVVRVNLLFSPDFWRSGLIPAPLAAGEGAGFGFVNAPGLPVPVWWATAAPNPVLTGWAGGTAARHLAGQSESEIRTAALRSLAFFLGTTEKAIAARLLDFRFHDWSKDPWTRGAYSYAAAGAEEGFRKLAAPVARTLFFAGEATAAEVGTIHGALASGLRAAREVDRAL
ncbi:MAG TPA: FAD-dependent oxidoreductase, partial [Candidatus Didemnitutus sp.]|nr:FAD-dependent oxidoreductase [Candidatus Didemnitutus sp.]